MCGDFKQTVNPVAKLDILSQNRGYFLIKLIGGCTFTKIDLSQAYLRLPLDKEYKWLIFKKVFKDTHGYCLAFQSSGYFLLNHGQYFAVSEHLQSLETVLDHLAKAGLCDK